MNSRIKHEASNNRTRSAMYRAFSVLGKMASKHLPATTYFGFSLYHTISGLFVMFHELLHSFLVAPCASLFLFVI